jgi:uncharacterized protein YaiE (UPF0345 family)
MKNVIASIVLVAIGVMGGMSLMVAGNVKYDTEAYTSVQRGDLEVVNGTSRVYEDGSIDWQPANSGQYLQPAVNPENVTTTNLEVR